MPDQNSEEQNSNQNQEAVKSLFESFAKNWPSPIVAREKISEFTGGAISPGTCANLDCLGIGIKGRIRIGRKVCYPTQSAIEWLIERAVAL